MAARRAPQIETPEVRDIEVAAEVRRISGDPGKRLRSRQIWEETGRRLGMSPDGGAGAVVRRSDVDRVAVISRRADGEPDQTPDFEVIE